MARQTSRATVMRCAGMPHPCSRARQACKLPGDVPKLISHPRSRLAVGEGTRAIADCSSVSLTQPSAPSSSRRRRRCRAPPAACERCRRTLGTGTRAPVLYTVQVPEKSASAVPLPNPTVPAWMCCRAASRALHPGPAGPTSPAVRRALRKPVARRIARIRITEATIFTDEADPLRQCALDTTRRPVKPRDPLAQQVANAVHRSIVVGEAGRGSRTWLRSRRQQQPCDHLPQRRS